MRRRRIKQIILFMLLHLITLFILLLPLQQGHFFGTNGDWYSQHIAIADSLRKAMLQSRNLVPQFIELGGGSSIYDFAYYGLLRPDILISCLFPKIEMKYFIAGYAILGVLASVDLCYIWLRKKHMEKMFAIIGAVFLGTATCFFHAHHQIMFVNYMPYFILALIGVDHLIDKKHYGMLTIGLFFVYIHSFYYAIACLFAAACYFFYRLGNESWFQEELNEKQYKKAFTDMMQYVGRAAFAVFLSVGMAAILLLPMGLDILSTKKDGGSFVSKTILPVDGQLSGLLYSPYGCGLTMIALFVLVNNLFRKGRRFFSGLLLFIMLCPAVAYVLNAFLYARGKILIPFVVLIVYLMAEMMQDIFHGERARIAVPLLVCLVFAICNKKMTALACIDVAILTIWIEIMNHSMCRFRKKAFWLVLLMPLAVSIGLSMSGSYLKEICSRLKINTYVVYLDNADERQRHISDEQIQEVVTDSRYRFDIISNNFVNSNLLASSRCGRTSMYSSVTNADYADFYYNTMHNPIGVNNRVALTPGYNPCFSYFMGIRYIVTGKHQIPDGYDSILENGKYVVAENENVLPVCYGTTNIMTESTYEQLGFPENMVALCQNVVVKGIGRSSNQREADTYRKAKQAVKQRNIQTFFTEKSFGEFLKVGQSGKAALEFTNSVRSHFLVLEFDVDRRDGREVRIEINGVVNKLSADWAPYPNENEHFVYVLPIKDGTKKLKVTAGKGYYQIKNVSAYLVEKKAVANDSVILPEITENKQDGSTIFEGTITMDQRGYFVTSYPYRDGYHVILDGKEVTARKVNTTFVGIPVTEGTHEISICYVAPGYFMGLTISIIGILCFAMAMVYEWSETFRSHSEQQEDLGLTETT